MGVTNYLLTGMEEILHHLGCTNPVNNGITSVPINWLAGFLPSTVWSFIRWGPCPWIIIPAGHQSSKNEPEILGKSCQFTVKKQGKSYKWHFKWVTGVISPDLLGLSFTPFTTGFPGPTLCDLFGMVKTSDPFWKISSWVRAEESPGKNIVCSLFASITGIFTTYMNRWFLWYMQVSIPYIECLGMDFLVCWCCGS